MAEDFFRSRYQSDNNNSIANSQPTGLTIQQGWGQVAGSGGASTTSVVTLPVAYSSISNVIVSFLGATATDSTPAANITDIEVGATLVSTAVSSITNTQFTVTLSASALATTRYWAYSWIAFGTV